MVFGIEVGWALFVMVRFRNKGISNDDAKEKPQVGAPYKPIIKASFGYGLGRSSNEAFVMKVERRA